MYGDPAKADALKNTHILTVYGDYIAQDSRWPGMRNTQMALNERYRHHYLEHQDDLSLFDGILDLLGELRQRQHFLAVATGKSRAGLNHVLERVELHDLFHATRTADETAGKPNPLMLHELMAELDVRPDRTLMIGDTTHDLEMAHHAGCASIGVSYGAHEPDAFSRWKPLTIAHSVTELRKWLMQHG